MLLLKDRLTTSKISGKHNHIVTLNSSGNTKKTWVGMGVATSNAHTHTQTTVTVTLLCMRRRSVKNLLHPPMCNSMYNMVLSNYISMRIH